MRTAVFIDGDSLHKFSRSEKFDVDFKRLREMYQQLTDTVTFEYYSIEVMVGEVSQHRKLLDWLETNGYRLRAIEVDANINDSVRIARTELVVWMALEIAAAAKRSERIVVWSADRALVRAIAAAQDAGAAVTIVADRTMISGTLMRSADVFTDARSLQGLIGQPKKAPAA